LSKQSKKDFSDLEEEKESVVSKAASSSGSSDGDEDDDEDGDGIGVEDLIYQPESNQRNWLKKHGKASYITFDSEQLQKLRDCFGALDDDDGGEIGIDELENPLIALGLVETRSQVEEIVMNVDEDKSGFIEFGEFLTIIKGGTGQKKEDT
jgi:hypothetical protein